MRRKFVALNDLRLCRSDKGDGGWSLHAPWATDSQIANGDEPPLQSGPAQWIREKWNRPNNLDKLRAYHILRAQEKALGR